MFSFKDEYGIIYEIFWETVSPFIDMVVISKDPVIPGQGPQGRIVSRERFVTGVVTTTRHVFEFDPSEPVSPTNMTLTAEGTSTSIEEFQSTFLCGKPFSDPFIWHYCNDIVDTVETVVTVGPKWEAAEAVSDPILWADADSGNDSVGEKCESLIWIDIFSNDDPLDCP